MGVEPKISVVSPKPPFPPGVAAFVPAACPPPPPPPDLPGPGFGAVLGVPVPPGYPCVQGVGGVFPNPPVVAGTDA